MLAGPKAGPKEKVGKLPADSVAAEDTYEAEAVAKEEAEPKERSSSEQEELLLTNFRNEAVTATTRFLRQLDGQSFVNEWRTFQLEVLNDLSGKFESAKVTRDELVRAPAEIEEMALLGDAKKTAASVAVIPNEQRSGSEVSVNG